MEHDEGISNPSGNRPFGDVLEARASRRGVLAGSLAAAAGGFFGSTVAQAGEKKGPPMPPRKMKHGKPGKRPVIGFDPVPTARANGPEPSISSDYEYQVIIPWGDPLEPGGPAWSEPDPYATPEELRKRAENQAQQIGIGHDGMWFFPYTKKTRYGKRFKSSRHGMLAINHEFGTNYHVLRKSLPESLEEVRISQHAHGVAVVALARWRNRWRVVRSKNSRRIHVNTPMAFSGPAAGHALLRTPNGNVPLGTVNNCAMGVTPWGTYLTCEENFNGYFGANGPWNPTELQARYGFSPNGFGYGWHLFDKRFDLSDPDYRNEENRFGWVVEIDPFDGTQKPVKRTALGRTKHEGGTTVVGKGGRAVVYMGDDQRFDYIYKFVSDDNWESMIARGESPLDHGTLYVAKFNDDGTGEWLPLTVDNLALQNHFQDQGELLVKTRIAADILGATPMDRPEWTAVAPNGMVYCSLTNNSRRTEADAANPLAPNPDGHIIRWLDADDHVGTTFDWDIYIISAETHGADDERTFSDPDGIWIDPEGRLFIETDGGQQKGMNDQLLVADTEDKSVIRRLFSGVTDCEITGITVTPDRRTMFINVQHPGNGDPMTTNFPKPVDGMSIPRDATIVITRKDGGVIGS